MSTAHKYVLAAAAAVIAATVILVVLITSGSRPAAQPPLAPAVTIPPATVPAPPPGPDHTFPAQAPSPARPAPPAPAPTAPASSDRAPAGTTVASGQTYYLYPVTPAPASPPSQPPPPTSAERAAETVAAHWVSAICAWNYQQPWQANIRAAGPLSVGGTPQDAPAWQIARSDWPTVTGQRLGSACTHITARVDHGNLSAPPPDHLAVIVTATQTLTRSGTAYQSQPVQEIRILTLTPAGWRVGPPTAAA